MKESAISRSFTIICTIILGAMQFNANAQTAHQLMRKGDEQYTKSQYSDAFETYMKAYEKDKNNPKIIYNLTNTVYREGAYKFAQDGFEKVAAAAKTTAERADAYHNLGNAYLKQEKYKEAVDAYQKSLMNRPGDPGSKMNLQMAKQKLKEQQEKEKQQQNNQQDQQNKDQQNQQSQNQNQQDQQQNKGQQNQQQQQQQNQQQNKESQGQNQNQQQQQNQEIPKLNQPSEQFLEAIGREDRRNKREYQEKTNNRKPSTRRKDWK